MSAGAPIHYAQAVEAGGAPRERDHVREFVGGEQRLVEQHKRDAGRDRGDHSRAHLQAEPRHLARAVEHGARRCLLSAV